MLIAIEEIANHTSTGAGSGVSTLGKVVAGRSQGSVSPRRIFQISGIAGGSVIKLQGSLDNVVWTDWQTGISADNAYIVDDGPLYMRSNCTTYGSGTVKVKVQTFMREDA